MQIVSNGSVTSPRGFLAGGAFAGIKTHGTGKKDLGLLVSTAPCAVAAVFTTNKVAAAPVLLSRQHAAAGRAQARDRQLGLRQRLHRPPGAGATPGR